MNKQFSEEKGDNISALPATVAGLSVKVPVGNIRQALAVAKVSGSDTVAISNSLERVVSLTQSLACLVGQHLNKVVGQEKVSFDVEPGAVSGNWAGTSAALPVKPVTVDNNNIIYLKSNIQCT